jgi:hypothetical protein
MGCLKKLKNSPKNYGSNSKAIEYSKSRINEKPTPAALAQLASITQKSY